MIQNDLGYSLKTWGMFGSTIREKAFALTAPDLAVSVESDSRQKHPQDQSCSV